MTHGGSVWIPDSFVAPEDLELHWGHDDLGVEASAVQVVFEVVSPDERAQDRDRVKKRREYARAGIPAYVLVDDYDDRGTVTLFTGPRPDKAATRPARAHPHASLPLPTR